MPSPYRFGCGERFKVHVPSGYDFKEVTVRCGTTSPTGDPWQCDKCQDDLEKQPVGSFRQDALEHGEVYDDEGGW